MNRKTNGLCGCRNQEKPCACCERRVSCVCMCRWLPYIYHPSLRTPGGSLGSKPPRCSHVDDGLHDGEECGADPRGAEGAVQPARAHGAGRHHRPSLRRRGRVQVPPWHRGPRLAPRASSRRLAALGRSELPVGGRGTVGAYSSRCCMLGIELAASKAAYSIASDEIQAPL